MIVGTEATEDRFQGVGYFAHRGAQTDGLNGQIQQVALATLGALAERVERGLNGLAIARGANLLQTGDLGITHGMVVDIEDVDVILFGQLVLVDADDDILARIDACLLLGSTGFDLHLGPARFHGLGHATHGFDFFHDGPGLVGHVLGELFHHVGAGPRIDHAGDVGFFLNDQLRVAGNACRELSRQCNGFVQCVGMQRLCTTEHSGQCFNGSAHDVVVGILLGQRPTRGLRVGTQHERLGALWIELRHHAVPQQTGGAHFGDF